MVMKSLEDTKFMLIFQRRVKWFHFDTLKKWTKDGEEAVWQEAGAVKAIDNE